MAQDTFRDWIPDGEDTGAQGDGFQDFVPDPVPTVKEEVKTPKEEELFKCDKCDFTTKYKLALQGHSRSHTSKK